jgi:hypothetical protein
MTKTIGHHLSSIVEPVCCKKQQKKVTKLVLKSMSEPLEQLGSIWYHSEPLEVPCYPNQFLDWGFF